MSHMFSPSWKNVNIAVNVITAMILVVLYLDRRSDADVKKYTPSFAYTYDLKRIISGTPNKKRWNDDKLIKNQIPMVQSVGDSNNQVQWNDPADIPSFKLFLLSEMSCVNNPFLKYGTIKDFQESAGRTRIYNEIGENHGESARCNCIQDKIEHIMSNTRDGENDEEFGDVILKLKTNTTQWKGVYEELIPKLHKQCKRFAASFEYSVEENKTECLVGVITWWCFSLAVLSCHEMWKEKTRMSGKKVFWSFTAIVFIAIGIGISATTPSKTTSPWFATFVSFSILLLIFSIVLDGKIEKNNGLLTIPFWFTYAFAASSNLSFIFTGEKTQKELVPLLWTTFSMFPLTLILACLTFWGENKQHKKDNVKHIQMFLHKWVWAIGMTVTVTAATTVCQRYNESLATPVKAMQFNTLLISSGILLLFPDMKWEGSKILKVFRILEQIARFVAAFMVFVLLSIIT